MWTFCFSCSVICLVAVIILSSVIRRKRYKKGKSFNYFNYLFGGVFFSGVFIFIPVLGSNATYSVTDTLKNILLTVLNAIQLFTLGASFSDIEGAIANCSESLAGTYLLWSSFIFLLAPVFTFGFVLSFFKNVSAYIKYLKCFFKNAYVFSELNEKSLTLARDIKLNNPKAAIVFTDVFDDSDEDMYELIESSNAIGAICFKKDIAVIDFGKHSSKKDITFFAMGKDETENLDQALGIIEKYKSRNLTNLYVFSTNVESELLLTSLEKGKIKVRRVNEIQSLVNRILYEDGHSVFKTAKPMDGGGKKISIVILGQGRFGTEFTKAFSWFCQMDGYKLEINAFDKEELAEDIFSATAPELMSPQYNGVEISGEASYKIAVHSGCDVFTNTFSEKLKNIGDVTYVLVALGDDETNIRAAINARMQFERMGIKPSVYAIVYNSTQKEALTDIANYRGQAYDINFIGDIKSSFAEKVIIDSELEHIALKQHLKWGSADDFWMYEYNYRSSVALAIHMKARISCAVSGAEKAEDEMSAEEKEKIVRLEHRRWNAYMRSEGYIYSGSPDKSTRNDLGKMHNDLVQYKTLSEDSKTKAEKVGTN